MTTASTPMPPALTNGPGNEESSKNSGLASKPAADRSMAGRDLTASVTRQVVADPMGLIRDLVKQPTVKKVLPIFVVLLVVAAFGLASMSMRNPTPHKPLGIVLSETDKKMAMEALKEAGIDAKLDQASGSVTVPEVLRPYMGGLEKLQA